MDFIYFSRPSRTCIQSRHNKDWFSWGSILLSWWGPLTSRNYTPWHDRGQHIIIMASAANDCTPHHVYPQLSSFISGGVRMKSGWWERQGNQAAKPHPWWEQISCSFVIREHLVMVVWCVKLELGSILPRKFQITGQRMHSLLFSVLAFLLSFKCYSFSQHPS